MSGEAVAITLLAGVAAIYVALDWYFRAEGRRLLMLSQQARRTQDERQDDVMAAVSGVVEAFSTMRHRDTHGTNRMRAAIDTLVRVTSSKGNA